MPQQRVFVSDSFTVLQGAFVTAVKTLKEDDPLAPVTVLAPSPLLAMRLRRALAWAGEGHWGVRIETLGDFAREVAEEALRQEGRRLLPQLAAPYLVRKLLAEAGPENYFAPLASLPGFPRSLLATLADLRHADVSPGLLRAFLDRAPQGEQSRQKLTSLWFLYERYERFLAEQGFYDDETIRERAINILEQDASTSPVLLYGFYDFTPVQRRLIAAATRGRDALVFFPWRAGEAYAYAMPTLTWLTNLGFVTAPLGAGAAEYETNLVRLQAQLFEDRPAVAESSARKSDASVLFLSAPGKTQEAREIARVILELVRTRGLRFSEIGIFLRDPAAYGQLLLDTLSRMDIPVFLHGGAPLLRTHAGQRLLLLCQVLLEEYARPRMLEFIRAAEPPLASLLGELAESAYPAQWETFSLQAGIVKGAAAWRARLSRLLLERQQEESAESAASRSLSSFIAFMDKFLSAGETRPSVETWRGWADFMVNLMRAYVSPTEHSGILEDTLLHLGELDRLVDPAPFVEWVKGVKSMLQAVSIPVGVFDQDGVFVGDLLAARGLQFRVVILPGLVDGMFPRLIRQDPLLLDQERQYISEVVSCELRQRRGFSEAEQLLLALAIQGAQEQVVLSYPRTEPGGEAMQTPSFYLLRALEAIRGIPATFSDLREWERRAPLFPTAVTAPQEAVDRIEYHLLRVGQAIASNDPAPLGYLPVLSPFATRAFHAVRQRRMSARLTRFDGVLEEADIKEKVRQYLFPRGIRVSASALEMYARCPFRYFLTTILGLSPVDEPENVLALQPRDRGALVHDILHDFFTRLRDAGQLPVRAAHKASLRQLLQHITDEHCRRFAGLGSVGLSLLWELEQERLRERLLVFLDQECEARDAFFPAAFEVRFGAEGRKDENASMSFPDGPVRFRLADGEEIFLHGRIDRIDLSVDQRHARIVDYKTGKAVRGRFAGGTALQLPLYLYAARSLWPEKSWDSATYTYVDRERRNSSSLFTETNWQASLATLQEIVTQLTSHLRAGCFAPTPDFCAPCPFPLICGGQVEGHMARKQQDPRLDALRQVRAVE